MYYIFFTFEQTALGRYVQMILCLVTLFIYKENINTYTAL